MEFTMHISFMKLFGVSWLKKILHMLKVFLIFVTQAPI